MQLNFFRGAVLLVAYLITGGTYANDSANEQSTKPVVRSGLKAEQARQERLRKRDEKLKAAAAVKLVDINTAGKNELKTLQGIGDAEAARIIAGRPYGSKAWLVTNNVLDAAVYAAIKRRVVAGPVAKTSEQNAAIYQKEGKK